MGGGEEGFRVGSIDLIVIWETNLALRHVVGLLAAGYVYTFRSLTP